VSEHAGTKTFAARAGVRAAKGVRASGGPVCSDIGPPLSETEETPMKLSAKPMLPRPVRAGGSATLPGLGDIEVLVRGTSNPDYRRRMQAMIRALPPSKRLKGVVDPVEMDRIIGTCLCDHVLLDWKNVQTDDGKQVAFSPDAARPFLTDPAYAAFRDGVLAAASSVDEELLEDHQDTEKNSAAPSTTA
jgi:hypothetical protein